MRDDVCEDLPDDDDVTDGVCVDGYSQADVSDIRRRRCNRESVPNNYRPILHALRKSGIYRR